MVKGIFKDRTTSAIGWLDQWIPSFLYSAHYIHVEKGNTLFGAITVREGILSTLSGGWLGDRLQKMSDKRYLLISGWWFLAGTPFAAWTILAPALACCMYAIFIVGFFLFINTGPFNTVFINVTNPAVHVMAIAVYIFYRNALGDAVSPSVPGWLSDQ